MAFFKLQQWMGQILGFFHISAGVFFGICFDGKCGTEVQFEKGNRYRRPVVRILCMKYFWTNHRSWVYSCVKTLRAKLVIDVWFCSLFFSKLHVPEDHFHAKKIGSPHCFLFGRECFREDRMYLFDVYNPQVLVRTHVWFPYYADWQVLGR